MPCWSRDQQLKPQGVLQRYKSSWRELCNVYFSTIYSANNFSILNPSRQDLTVKVHSLLEIKTFRIKYCHNQAFTTTSARYCRPSHCEQYATYCAWQSSKGVFQAILPKKTFLSQSVAKTQTGRGQLYLWSQRATHKRCLMPCRPIMISVTLWEFMPARSHVNQRRCRWTKIFTPECVQQQQPLLNFLLHCNCCASRSMSVDRIKNTQNPFL